MKPPIALVLCLALTGGCATKRGAGIGAGVGAGVAVGGVVFLTATGPHGSASPSVIAGGLIIPAGVFLLAGSLVNLAILAARSDPEPPAAARADDRRARDTARRLDEEEDADAEAPAAP